ncbi:sulfatase family protein [Saccharicrinis fermentans]|uniref:Arylsulfatase n=1 Tax=Saccharicrinis fermentans DSM 9555 = JCM 21142 TaxID=869213 RepID=W7XV94_9BACT|nr:sulfatase-like hydrolase/transferase [Saccharicrinis fermentans]GAF02010.1 arylsulfatase precursor [Saccharicrinis fermentans DSM 9555 = JCM 21142]
MKCYFLSITVLVFSMLFGSCSSENASQPNIVVILCDDLGYGDLSSFGHPVIKTPNLDQMANDGIKFTNCYSAAPVCSPSRAGLLTGRSPNKAGIYDFIPGVKKSEDCRDMVHLQEHEKTIPAMLKSVGYTTCLSGKWHCSSRFNSDQQPKPDYFGFDYWFSTHNNAAPSHENPNNFVRNGEKVGVLKGFSCQLVVDEAIHWLKNKQKNKPFYLQVCFHEPHEPIASPKDMVDSYLPKSENENQALYFANVANMDKAVGRLIQYLKDSGCDENTLIFFTSDNGPETLNRYAKAKRSYGSPGDLKGMKLWTNEAGFRVPGILYWMGQKTYKGSSDAVISSLDLLPTFAQLSGAELPNRILDGESIVPLIKTGEQKRTKPLIWAFYNALNEQQVAMRSGDWKILCKLKNDTSYIPRLNNIYKGNEKLVKEAHMVDFELYNMKNDWEESENVLTQYPEVFERLKAQFEDEYRKLLDESFVWVRKEE